MPASDARCSDRAALMGCSMYCEEFYGYFALLLWPTLIV